tara:strand:+ start:816 stop:1010 length:195 start_codon:yes stop_codon:yes gene_type:complete
MDSDKIDEMLACFLQCDKLHLIEYLEVLVNELSCVYSEDDEILSESDDETYEIISDANGFLSLV